MKLNRKSTALISAVVGAAILSTSALADVMIGSGYNGLKTAAKTTAAKLTDEVNNFSASVAVSFKVDDLLVSGSNVDMKYDIAGKQLETKNFDVENGSNTESYRYRNAETEIYGSEEEGYNVYNRRRDDEEFSIITDPFKEEEANDIEKIADALVGSMQDMIQTEETDGGKMYIGNLTDSSVPPLVNAVASFVLKNSAVDNYAAERLKIARPVENIYLINASGKAFENKDGILENVIFTVSLSGDDKKGQTHTYSMEFAATITKVNATYVEPINLEGKEVTYSEDNSYVLSKKYIGTYKSVVIDETNDAFVKVGERFLEITSIENGIATGRYYEVFEGDFAQDHQALEFEFSAKQDERRHMLTFEYTDTDGQSTNGMIRENGNAGIYIELGVTIHEDGGWSTQSRIYDAGEFVRVFE